MPEFSENLKTETTEQLIARIKERAGRLILDAAPDWKQRNMLATILNVLLLAVVAFLTELVKTETTEVSHLKTAAQTTLTSIQTQIPEATAFWADVVAIRTLSDQLEVDALAGETIDVPNGTSASHPDGWPTI